MEAANYWPIQASNFEGVRQMSLHLWSWIAIGMQFVLAILFGAIAQTKLGNPLRKILFGLAILLLFHTIISYFVANRTHPILTIKKADDSYASWMAWNTSLWLLYSLCFYLFAWIAFCGSFLLASCRLTDRGLLLARQSLAYRYLAFVGGSSLDIERDITRDNICGLTWKNGASGFLCFLVISFVLAVTLLAGLVSFIVAGFRPLYPTHYFCWDVLLSPKPKESWPGVRLRGIRLIPILLPFYPIWGLAKGIVWLLGLIPKRLPPLRLKHRPQPIPSLTQPSLIQPPLEYLEPIRPLPRQPGWISRHLLRPASQSLRWLGQLLVAVKRGACPRIELEDS